MSLEHARVTLRGKIVKTMNFVEMMEYSIIYEDAYSAGNRKCKSRNLLIKSGF